MPQFKFNKDFDWKPTSQTTVAFRAGYEGLITTAAADAAVAAGVGEIVTKDAAPAKAVAKTNG